MRHEDWIGDRTEGKRAVETQGFLGHTIKGKNDTHSYGSILLTCVKELWVTNAARANTNSKMATSPPKAGLEAKGLWG